MPGSLSSNLTQGMNVWYAYVFILCLCCPVFRQRPCDEVITSPRSPTTCKMIMKLRNQRPGPKGAVEPVKKKKNKWVKINNLRFVIISNLEWVRPNSVRSLALDNFGQLVLAAVFTSLQATVIRMEYDRFRNWNNRWTLDILYRLLQISRNSVAIPLLRPHNADLAC
jgi:hypothetical protein